MYYSTTYDNHTKIYKTSDYDDLSQVPTMGFIARLRTASEGESQNKPKVEEALTIKGKRELLKGYIGQLAYSHHTGPNEIVNSKSMVRITKETINKIANRKMCFIGDGRPMDKCLGFEGRGG